jgi:hypothetical protein
MKLNLRALALTAAIFGGLSLLIPGIANLIWSGYGTTFLQVMASLYPGYDAARNLGNVIVGTLYALVDGAVAGLIFGWLYNLFVAKGSTA